MDISLHSTLCFAYNHSQFGLVYCNIASGLFKYSFFNLLKWTINPHARGKATQLFIFGCSVVVGKTDLRCILVPQSSELASGLKFATLHLTKGP